ncbi:hypothetical protein [Phenylobacterium sp.]|uniref:hypothetical protein n=1 Tax=Phenylobacterium sp. TaxID=1871053 RepID=UPI0035C7F812
MKLSKLVCAALTASILATVTLANANAESASENEQVVRAERSSNPKDVFVRTIKPPAAKRDSAAAAHHCPCPMMGGAAAGGASPSQPSPE